MSKEEISNLIEFVFLQEFRNVNNGNIIAKIYTLKFLTTFRLQIPKEWLKSVVDMLVGMLNTNNNVMQSATLLTLEKLLFMRDLNGNFSDVKEAINNQETFNNLMGSLVLIVGKEPNIFAIRCFFRTIYLCSETFYKIIMESLISSINEILKLIILNSSQDQYNYFLFETIAILIKRLSISDFELYSHFIKSINSNLIIILQNSITDLTGYVFQIFAQQLSLVKDGDSTEFYEVINNFV